MKMVLLATIIGLLVGCVTTISGTLTSKDSEQALPYENARVNISRLDKTNIAKENYVVPVDDEGRFSTTVDLEKGLYLVEALVPGFATASKTFELKSSKKLQISLTPLDNPKTSAIAPNIHVELGKGEGGASLMPPNL